jgi:hypothetical protein
MATRGGINTVLIDGEYRHITDVGQTVLCNEWSKRQREINELYSINTKANKGWRGVILKLIGINLPMRKRGLYFDDSQASRDNIGNFKRVFPTSFNDNSET